MTGRCRVCRSDLGSPAYRSAAERSVTSLGPAVDQPTVVYLCSACGHAQTPPLDDLDAYYATGYPLLIASDEEDQLYDVVDGEIIYRAAHQADAILGHLALPSGGRVLDYGSAKGATLRRIQQARPDLSMSLFDVTDTYVSFWERGFPPGSWAIHETPADWGGSFDAVLSLFVLEHVEDPVGTVRDMARTLRPSGTLWLLVPDVGTNVAELVVVDHINHFSLPSILAALAQAGLRAVFASREVHRGAWAVAAVREDGPPKVVATDDDLGQAKALVTRAAAIWQSIDEQLRVAEVAIDGAPTVVYGAGFYGSYVTAALDALPVVAFLDRNPHLRGTTFLGRPVLEPTALPDRVQDVIVAVNPSVARAAIDGVDWGDRAVRFHWLDPESAFRGPAR